MTRNYQNDGQNRCRRCDRPLSNPEDIYGWRCAQIMGIDNNGNDPVLDSDAQEVYNAYVARYLAEDIEDYDNLVRTNWAVDWVREISRAQQEMEKAKFNGENELLKDVQRRIWRFGAQHLLREKWGYLTSAWMLEHSLDDNPSDIWRGNDSRIAYLINNDPAYLNKLDEAIKNSKDGRIDEDLEEIQFNNGDLYYSIHKATIHVTGYLQTNGKWIVHAKMDDTYDFTEIQTFMDDNGGWSTRVGLGTVANDVAVVSQILGAINPYKVVVEFYTTR